MLLWLAPMSLFMSMAMSFIIHPVKWLDDRCNLMWFAARNFEFNHLYQLQHIVLFYTTVWVMQSTYVSPSQAHPLTQTLLSAVSREFESNIEIVSTSKVFGRPVRHPTHL